MLIVRGAGREAPAPARSTLQYMFDPGRAGIPGNTPNHVGDGCDPNQALLDAAIRRMQNRRFKCPSWNCRAIEAHWSGLLFSASGPAKSLHATEWSMDIDFIYFDLGNVLLYFDREIGFRALAAEAGCSVDLVRKTIMDTGILWRYEEGGVTGRQFHSFFQESTDTRIDFDRFQLLHSAIFELNVSIVPVVAGLAAAGYRLGVLSNICEAHWDYCLGGRYALLPTYFEVLVPSFKIGAMKPHRRIFDAASEMARTSPERIFFMDDTPGHIAGAVDAGWDAVRYLSTSRLVDDLRARNVVFNY